MRRAQWWVSLFAVGSTVLTAEARAEEEKSWFDSAPEDGEAEAEDADESDDASEEGAEDDGEGSSSAGASWLTPGTIALFGGVHLGMGGSIVLEAEGLDAEDDLTATIGLQLGAEYVILDYFAAGAELRLSGINTKGADKLDRGRDALIDVVLRPRGRYVFESIGLEAYAVLPFGLSFPNVNDDKTGDASMGFTLGAGLGANYMLGEHFGLGSDFTWLFHWFGMEETNTANNDMIEYDVKLSQFTWFIHALYAL